MTNMMYFFVMCVLIFVISECYGVGIEYYDDQDDSDIPTEDTISADARRIVHNDNFKNSSVWEHNVKNYSNSNSSGKNNNNDHDNPMLGNLGEHRNQTNQYFNEPLTYDYSSKLSGSFDKENDTVTINSDIPLLSSDIFKEYEYIYDDDTKPHMLRQHSQKPEQVKTINNVENNRKLPLTDFYNLEPAIRYLNLSYKYSKNDNLWFVQEDLPCWELPLLYGELSKMKKYSEVFTMRGGELKNVIVNDSNFDWSPSSNKRTSPPLNYYTSKWCTVEPCYGDHTLCLFSDKTTSSLCDKNYKVNVPSIIEQTALVNTINSMRNKIANGESDRYPYLPPAANMKQITYDYDLEEIAKVWLYQCLPGSAPCSALDDTFVTQLECTKYAKYCCLNIQRVQFTKCIPKPECFVLPVIGCLHVWFWSAGAKLTTTDVLCGHTSVLTYNTVQLLWANTNKIGCAYGQNDVGDVRVICNFSPGAPFIVDSKYYCGIVRYIEQPYVYNMNNDFDENVLMSLGINLKHISKRSDSDTTSTTESNFREFGEHSDSYWGVNILSKIYKGGWVRNLLKDYSSGTKNYIARLVVKYEFIEQSGARCDSENPIYVAGAPSSQCVERGRRYQGLCYDFRDPTPVYRLVAVIAPIALFSLILYDLFSGVVRQTNY